MKVKRGKYIIIQCEKNASGQSRTANIVIDADGLKKDLLITQTGKPVTQKIKIKNILCDFYAIKESQRGLEVQYTIIGTDESDPKNGIISNLSPVGSALLGHKVGETVAVSTPNGVVNYKILSITV